jgi:hypothetical protein
MLGVKKKEGIDMTEYTAVVKQDGDWWLVWIEELPGAPRM